MAEFVIFHIVCEWGKDVKSCHTVWTDENVARRMFAHLVTVDGKKISLGLVKFSKVSLYCYDHKETVACCEQESSDHNRWINDF